MIAKAWLECRDNSRANALRSPLIGSRCRRVRDVAHSWRKSYGVRRFSPADNRPTRGTTRGARVSGANGGNAALARRLASAAAASGLRTRASRRLVGADQRRLKPREVSRMQAVIQRRPAATLTPSHARSSAGPEALTGARAGRYEPRKTNAAARRSLGVANEIAPGNHSTASLSRCGELAVEPALGNSSHGNRESRLSPAHRSAGRIGKSEDAPMSRRPAVAPPRRAEPNNAGAGRGGGGKGAAAKENSPKRNAARTQAGTSRPARSSEYDKQHSETGNNGSRRVLHHVTTWNGSGRPTTR